MKIFLAGTYTREKVINNERCSDIKYILESFFYILPWQLEYWRADKCQEFMLDSGAFTYMGSGGKGVNWDTLIYRYVECIKNNGIDLFFEMDVDNILGLKEVIKMRNKIESLTGKQCIPVWHRSRGKQSFLDLLKEYKYVAIGGIVKREIKKADYKYLHWFIDKAHESGCKIHGMGFTPLKELSQFSFDSVDSKTWLSGSLGAAIYKFNGVDLVSERRPKLKRVDYKIVDTHNINQWVLYQKYMEGRCC